MLSINHLQLGKFPCPRKSPNGEFGGFWQISALRNADFSNSLFCRNRDKSLQFNLKYRYKKSRMACHHPASRQKNGGKDQDRTGDTRIFSPLLYLLSYPATLVVNARLPSGFARCFITLAFFFKIANFFCFFLLFFAFEAQIFHVFSKIVHISGS